MGQREYLDPAPTVATGFYRHFKGGIYLVIGVARRSENLNEFDVVYYSVERKHMLTRPLRSPEGLPDDKRNGFFDDVDRAEYRGPRFRKMSPDECPGAEPWQVIRQAFGTVLVPRESLTAEQEAVIDRPEAAKGKGRRSAPAPQEQGGLFGEEQPAKGGTGEGQYKSGY